MQEAAPLLGSYGSSPGVLRILARRNDSEVLILHGEEREIRDGERLVWIEQLPSNAVAEAVSGECSRTLADCPSFAPGADGWHPFEVAHLPNLVIKAKTHLNVTYRLRQEPPRDRQAWTGKRIALVGFLAGQGWTAKRIAEHPLIRSTEGNIFKQAHKFEIPLPGSSQCQLVIRSLPVSVKAKLQGAVLRANLTDEAFARSLLIKAVENL